MLKQLSASVLFATMVMAAEADTTKGSLPGAVTNATPVTVACVGDSITYGSAISNRARDSYPAKLQSMLGEGFRVVNFGVGSATLIRKGHPTVWSQLEGIRKAAPEIIVISLGTNDTCGGRRKCWDHKDEFPGDYRDLLNELRLLPSKPRIWICAPSPMVIETPGLSADRVQNLEERTVKLQELITIIKTIAKECEVGFIDLNTPLANHPELFTKGDGVHPNKAGYEAIAKRVHAALVQPQN